MLVDVNNLNIKRISCRLFWASRLNKKHKKKRTNGKYYPVNLFLENKNYKTMEAMGKLRRSLIILFGEHFAFSVVSDRVSFKPYLQGVW